MLVDTVGPNANVMYPYAPRDALAPAVVYADACAKLIREKLHRPDANRQYTEDVVRVYCFVAKLQEWYDYHREPEMLLVQ